VQPSAVEKDTAEPPLICWPLDHYYSPIPDNRLLARDPAQSRVWPARPRTTHGIDWRASSQLGLLASFGELDDFQIAETATGDPHEYHADNEMFSRLDAWMLQAMVRHFRPARVIEVGSGWSSLVTARVSREHLEGRLDFTCIEPYPPEFLTGVDGVTRIIESRVEEVPVELFLKLAANDVLFIDSSHTVKTGGDVVFLFEEVIPRLAPGVIVHVHDIFLPWDYPRQWVMWGRAWNEQYLVRAFLAFNAEFSIALSVGWLVYYHPEALAAVLPKYDDALRGGGGSLWLQRRPSGDRLTRGAGSSAAA
jgi:hypothetical protein